MTSGLFSLQDALSNFVLPSNLTDAQLLARSYYLSSLGYNPYKDVNPSFTQTQFSPSRNINIFIFFS
jgi:hypothetical protein